MLTQYNGKNLIDLVGTVYDCIADSLLWQGALDQVRDVCDGYVATLGMLDVENNLTRFTVESGNPEVFAPIANIQATAYSFLPAVQKMEVDQPYMISSIYAVQGSDSRNQWLESRLHKEWALPNKIDDCIWLPLVKTPSKIGHLVVMTHVDRGPVTQADLDIMAQLAPHIRRAVTISDLFEAQRNVNDMFRDIIDALVTPVFIVTAEMRVLFANTSGQAMLSSRDVVSISNGKLDFSFNLANNSIGHAVTTSKQDEFKLGPYGIGIPLKRAAVPAVAHVMPLVRRGGANRISNQAAAAIFIAQSGQKATAAIDAIGALFGLTPTEKLVADMIGKGKRPADIALLSGTQETTVRTHLRILFEKTNTNDQRELNDLIRDLTPPVKN